MGVRAAALMCVVAGCGRLDFDSSGIAPSVCESFQWNTVVGGDVDLSVAVMADAVAVGWVPHSTGALYGATLASDWSMTSPSTGTMIKTGNWIGGAVAYVDGQLVAGESENNLATVKYDALDSALAITHNEFGCPRARFLSKPPLVHAGADLIAPTVWDDGLSVWPISSWSLSGTPTLTVPTPPATGIAATDVGNDAFVVWATSDACKTELLSDASTGIHRVSVLGCPGPRLAADGLTAALVHETLVGAALTIDRPTTLDPAAATIFASGATSPRIAYDGTRYWVSSLDVDGTIGVSYLQAGHVSTPIHLAHAPMHDAYELAIIRSEPWLFALDGSGLSATRICTP